ncbi:MAG: hypothetical protein J6Q55_03740, partial [Clostridia bacterium]|nr:hypothetical protein [Clostridia bacterium]
TFSTDTTKAFNTQIKAAEAWFASQFEAGKIVLVRFQDAEDFGWHVVLGVDIVDADWARDGIIIFGDPNDGSDHCQDGYYTMGFGRFCRWWLEVGYNKDEAKMMGSNQFDCVVVTPEKAYEIVRGPETMAPQTAYEKHLLLNADGSYAGNTDTSKYGTGTPLNGVGIDRPDLNYHKIVDVYNLVPNDHLHILPQFRAYEQTMASSCALVSLMVVLNYYGYDIVDKYSEVALYDGYNDYFNIDITGKGSSASGRDTFMKSLGFNMKTNVRDIDTKTKFTFPTYNSFAAWVKENVAAGYPMPISWTPIGGHGVTLIGMDDMGTEYTYDDVVFIADSGDTWDNYMDGYNVISAQMFYRQWHGNPAPGKETNAQQYNLIIKTN